MSFDFFNLRNCYNSFQSPNEWENPGNCGDTLNWLNRKIYTESLELFNINVLLGSPSWTNTCSVSPIWHYWYPKGRVAIFAAFLLFYVFVIPIVCIRSRRNSFKAGRIVSVFGYGLAVICMVLYLILAIIGDTFLNCIKIGDSDYFKIFVVVNIFRNAANVLILGVILLPLTRRVMHHGQYGAAFPTVMNLILLLLVGAMYVISVVLYNLATINAFNGSDVIDNSNISEAVYVTLYLIAAICGGFWITHSVSGMRKHARAMKGVSPYANVLAITLVLFAVIDFVAIFGWKVHFMVFTRTTSFIFTVLSLFFQALVFLLVAKLAGARGLTQATKSSPRLKTVTPPPEIPQLVLAHHREGVAEDGLMGRSAYVIDEERIIDSKRASHHSMAAHVVTTRHHPDEEIESDIESDLSSLHSSELSDSDDDDDDVSSLHSHEIHSVHTRHTISRHGSGSDTDVDHGIGPAVGGGALNSHPTGKFPEHVEGGSVKYA